MLLLSKTLKENSKSHHLKLHFAMILIIMLKILLFFGSHFSIQILNVKKYEGEWWHSG
jgi:hypothetical protein